MSNTVEIDDMDVAFECETCGEFFDMSDDGNYHPYARTVTGRTIFRHACPHCGEWVRGGEEADNYND